MLYSVKNFYRPINMINFDLVFLHEKGFIVIIFFMMSFLGYSQLKIKVVDDTSQKPVSNAKISCDNKIIGYTNAQGFLEFKTECKDIEIDAEFYQKEIVSIESSMEVSLIRKSSKTTNIEAVVIEDKSDPRALEILKKSKQTVQR